MNWSALDSFDVLDTLFQEAVAAIDQGDLPALEALVASHPRLLSDRLDQPGAWLREKVAGALDGFFSRPYLLWFVAEDPVRNGSLPDNIAEVARWIIAAAKQAEIPTLQEQLDHATRLVAWSWIARDSGVQIGLIDALADGGARLDGAPDNALVNHNFAAAEHLVARGAKLTLATALCQGRWEDVERLATETSARERQFGFVLAALNGQAEAVRRMVAYGAPINEPAQNLYSHGTPLHHAVSSASLDTVKVLVEAGADLTVRDSLWDGTPFGWAEYCGGEASDPARKDAYREIAEYLKGISD
jgi:peptide-methionine (S)-S-oxide reductase